MLRTSLMFDISPKWIYIPLLLFCLTGCGSEGEMRQYTEIRFSFPEQAGFMDPTGSMRSADPRVQEMVAKSAVAAPLSWTTPSEWIEEKGSGMRLASFRSRDDDPILCTIIMLGGAAGGEEANVRRWLRQLSIDITEGELQNFLDQNRKISSRGDYSLTVADFRALQKVSGGDAPSMIAAFTKTKTNDSVFIKMTGTKRAVSKHYENFMSLIRSLQ